MSKFEAKLKKALHESVANTPDYWEDISKKTNIPYDGRMIMKKTPERNIFRLRYAVPAVCGFALVAVLLLTNIMGNKQPNLGGDVNGTQTVENLQINNIISSIGAKIRIPEDGTTETVPYDKYLEQAGMSLNLWLPKGLANTEDAFVYYNADGSEFMMGGYTFSDPSTGESLLIRFQKDSLPITDTKYQFDNQLSSKINGEDIVIGYSAEQDAYYTTFIYKGIGYDLTGTQGFSQEDFISVIQSILQ